jgi:hemolysin-activating ACP:hemolysin acyltransferase
MQQASTDDEANQTVRPATLRLVQPDNPYVALGLAVSQLMVQPAFAKLRFGDWSRVLVGQINRGHYAFAMDAKDQIQGFLGWALASSDKAEAWVTGRAALSYEDSRDGDCLLINAWAANTPEASRLLRDAARRIARGKQAIYFRRHYKDGAVRPMRLNVNAFVEQHLEQVDGAV